MTAVVPLLPGYLAWSRDQGVTDALRETLVLTCCDRLARVLRWLGERDPPRAATIEARMRGLPDEALMRALTAPESGFRLGYDGADRVESTAAYLEQVLTAEECRLGGCDAAGGPVWTALGDRCFTPGGKVLVAPELEGIVIDFASPNALGTLPHIAGAAEPIDAGDREVALGRIGDALDIVQRTGGGAHRMVHAFTRVIVVRSDPSAPGFYTSASSTLSLGRAVVRNPFVVAATPSELADGLVHEAIHCVCDLSEIHDGRWLVGDRDVYHNRLPSPWTGRSLDLHTYLQACWVWFGLWHFWAQALEADAIEAADGLRCVGRAYQGFAGGEAVERLAPYRAMIRHDLADALGTAQAALRDRMDRWGREVACALDQPATP
ncbi:MAG: hypothetical protein JWN59_1327 [Sphingomonas bacterium]|nr:hypothetical protein [Sphingomonas bacterium]